ncbi:MAG: CPBP family intramembrane glutamic endopeptidase, partial [Thermoplasmata archaeon]
PVLNPSFELLPSADDNINEYSSRFNSLLMDTLLSSPAIFFQTVLLDGFCVGIVLFHIARTSVLGPKEMGLPFNWAEKLFALCKGWQIAPVSSYSEIEENLYSDGNFNYILIKSPTLSPDASNVKLNIPETIKKVDLKLLSSGCSSETELEKGFFSWPPQSASVIKVILYGLVGGGIALGILGGLSYLFSELTGIEVDNVAFGKPDNLLDSILLFLSVVVLAPCCEEFFFRAYIFTSLKRAHGLWIGFIGSALLFSLAHLSPFSFVFIVLAGLLLAFLQQKTGNILANIMTHAINNLVFFIALFL